MKLLLDECVTHDLRVDLVGHEVHTVDEAGLKGLENGDLLKAAAGVYEVSDYRRSEHSLPTKHC
jgi:hypothetical protein